MLDYPILTFAVVILGLLIAGPIILKFVRSTLTPFSYALGNTSGAGGAIASANVNHVLGVFVNFWDGVVIMAFLVAVIMLFISSFFIDASPFFMIVYIILLFLTILFAPEILGAVNNIYEANQFAEEVALLGFLDFVRLNFGVILVAIGILTMVIIYAKLRWGGK